MVENTEENCKASTHPYTTIPYYYIVALNSNNELFKERLVRIALNYAIDKELVLKNAFNGEVVESLSYMYPLSSSNNGRKPYPYDPQKALEFLRIAGWDFRKGYSSLRKKEKGFEFKLLVSKSISYEWETARYIEEHLSDIGISIMIQEMPINKKVTSLFKRQYESSIIASNSEIDLESSYNFFHSSQIKDGLNFYSYHNPKVDDLLEQGRMEMNEEKRFKIAIEFQKELYDDPPGIFLFWRGPSITVHKSTIEPPNRKESRSKGL